MKDKEYILCAATWYKEVEKPVHSPINITEGVVVCGFRHPNVIGIVHALSTKPSSAFDYAKVVQGFLSSKNRFLTREEAADIAFVAGQIDTKIKRLYSEDLY